MKYNQCVETHFFSPRNLGEKTKCSASVVSSVGSKELGDAVRVVMACNREDAILDFKYKVFGNPYLIAAMSYWSEKLIGASLADASTFSHHELVEVLEIPKTKLYCALMAEDVLKQAIVKWRKK